MQEETFERKFGRVAFIEIAGGPDFKQFAENGITNEYKWERISGLDFKFDISFPLFSAEAVANISVLGLNRNTIEKISSWGGMATTNSQNWLIRLYAGYGDKESDVPCIFEGQIITAMPTMPPEVWLNIQARTFYGRRHLFVTKDISVVMKNVERKTRFVNYVAAFADYLGASYDATNLTPIDKYLDKVITSPVYDKPTSHTKVLNDFSTLCKSVGVAYFSVYQASGKQCLMLFPYVMESDFEPKNPIKISKDNGMIGIPRMTWAEIEVTRFMTNDSADRRLMFIDVDSRFAMPGMYDAKGNRRNGSEANRAIFRVNYVRYHGHLRGNEWYVTYKAWRNFRKSDIIQKT